ncbi:MAG: nickel pincer cofactor biosynthesis protein LarB [Candidatus Competibacteraceae bacterium]
MVERDIKLDFQRRARLGLDEAIFCGHKTVAQLIAILEQARERNTTLLLTRLDEAQLAVLPESYRSHLDYEPVSRTAFYGTVPAPISTLTVAVVTAGTSDIAVSREAARTLIYHGVGCEEINDVGVAGLWRLLERVEELQRFPVLIVTAGMDAALPSVIAGLVPGLVITVPSSVGYGVAQGGETALRAALASCAPGVVVVNIDNGYGAACAALRILNRLGEKFSA